MSPGSATLGSGGGGGRIAIYYTNSSFDGEFDARGGESRDQEAGAAGTVYQESSFGQRSLLVDNGGAEIDDVRTLPRIYFHYLIYTYLQIYNINLYLFDHQKKIAEIIKGIRHPPKSFRIRSFIYQ